MIIVIAVPALVCLVGLVIYLATTAPKVQEIGRVMFAMGLLAFLLRLAVDHLARIG